MTTEPTPATNPATTAPRRKRSPWPYALVAVFVAQSVILATTMTLAARSPANAEPDYYAKALDWNEQAEALARPEREGWRTSLAASARVENDARTLTLELADADGAPITGAKPVVTTFHRAAALDRTIAQLTEVEPGRYEAPLPMTRPGLWEVRVEITTADAHTAALVQTVEIPSQTPRP